MYVMYPFFAIAWAGKLSKLTFFFFLNSSASIFTSSHGHITANSHLISHCLLLHLPNVCSQVPDVRVSDISRRNVTENSPPGVRVSDISRRNVTENSQGGVTVGRET